MTLVRNPKTFWRIRSIWGHPKPRQGGFAPWTPNLYNISCFCTRERQRTTRSASTHEKHYQKRALLDELDQEGNQQGINSDGFGKCQIKDRSEERRVGK